MCSVFFSLSHEVCHIPVILLKHIVGLAEPVIVKGDFSQCIQPVTYQHDVFLGQHLRCHCKGEPVLPVALRHPLHVQLIIGDKRIGDMAQGQQIRVNAAGH